LGGGGGETLGGGTDSKGGGKRSGRRRRDLKAKVSAIKVLKREFRGGGGYNDSKQDRRATKGGRLEQEAEKKGTNQTEN